MLTILHDVVGAVTQSLQVQLNHMQGVKEQDSTGSAVACVLTKRRAARHADASPSAPRRSVTAVLYLNPGRWDAARDGGGLRLYNHSAGACVLCRMWLSVSFIHV